MRKIISFFAFVAIVISFAACNNGGNTPEVTVLGAFSVGNGKQVYFAKGNLWWSTNPITLEKNWFFAPHQWDMIGDDPYSIHTERYSWNELKESLDNWTINTIQNGDGYTWRVLNNDEWNYLFHGRDNADQLFTHANVYGVNGVIILPDDWDIDHETDLTLNRLEWDVHGGQYSGDSKNDYYAINTITDQWDALEKKGAIFLPAAGSAIPNKPIEGFGKDGAYWSSTPTPRYVAEDHIYYLLFERYALYPSWSYIPSILRTVRLVRDVK